jgi:hypothetical protein
MTEKQGAAKPGPSKVYIRLLEGKISSKRYADTVIRSTGAKSNGSSKPS